MSVLWLGVAILGSIVVAPYIVYHIMRFGALGWYSGKRRVIGRKGVRRTYDNER